jgi:hypothetical protein
MDQTADTPPPETPTEAVASDLPKNIWMHGLLMLVMLVLLRVATTLLTLCAVIQFLWMLIGKSRNEGIKSFGEGLAHWLEVASLFLAGKSDVKPFPWSAWK